MKAPQKLQVTILLQEQEVRASSLAGPLVRSLLILLYALLLGFLQSQVQALTSQSA